MKRTYQPNKRKPAVPFSPVVVQRAASVSLSSDV